MIRDGRALQPEYVPRQLVHRDGAIDALTSWLDPLQHGRPGENGFVFGPTGSGKTTLAKHVVDQLRQATLSFRWGYADCMQDPTPAATLSTLVRDAGLGTRRPSGTPRVHYFDLLRAADDQVLLVIDEVNVLSDLDLLHAVYGLDGVTVLAICVDEDSLFSEAEVSSQTRSRLHAFRTLELASYSHSELVDILQYRVEHGLAPGRVDSAAVDMIADVAAGDARAAIALLRRAAEQARDDGGDVTPALVERVRDGARAAIRERRVRSLGTHQRALFAIIRDAGELDAGTLHARYEERIQEPRSKSMRRRYLAALERYDLIEQHGSGRGTRYSVLGDP